MRTVYDTTGNIKYVDLADHVIPLELEAGEAYIEGYGEPGIDRVVNNKIVKGTASQEMLLYAIRCQRDRLLTTTDWVSLRASDAKEPVPQAWLDYRQALRDITKQSDPHNIVWPTVPTQ